MDAQVKAGARPLLALETATREASVAVVGRDGRVAAAAADRVTTHAERLLPLIAAVLARAGVVPAGLAGVACGAGPGSFTGLRIGLATAKGLCLAADLPLVMVPSLAALALGAGAGRLVAACLDARRGEVFLAVYRTGARAADGVVEVLAPCALAPDAVGARLTAALGAGARVALVGDALARHREALLAGIGEVEVEPMERPSVPGAIETALLAWPRLGRGEGDDVAAAVPAYVRAPELRMPPR